MRQLAVVVTLTLVLAACEDLTGPVTVLRDKPERPSLQSGVPPANWTFRGNNPNACGPVNPANPGARAGHAMAPSGQPLSVVIFGGTRCQGFTDLNDTWLYTTNTNVFTPIANTTFLTLPGPSARQGVAMAYDSTTRSIVLFGGFANASFTFFNDTWTLKLTAKGIWQWTQASPTISPPARAFHSMAYDARSGAVVVYGGRNGAGVPFNDFWKFVGGNWVQLLSPSSPPLSGASLTPLGRTRDLKLFGGLSTGGVASQQLFSWNGTFWSGEGAGPFCGATWPCARSQHAAAPYPPANSFVMFGGRDAFFAMTNQTWSRVFAPTPFWTLSSTSGPIARYYMSMAYDGLSSIVLYGGFDSGFNALGDVWVWGRLAGCVPATGAEIHPGDEVRCFFEQKDGERLVAWEVDGFGAQNGELADVRPTFRAKGPGSASITVRWTDAIGQSEEQTFTYQVSGGPTN